MEAWRGKWVSHQVPHEGVRDVELEGAGAAHVRGVAQVVDGEVQREGLLAGLPSCGGCRERQGLWEMGRPRSTHSGASKGLLVLLPVNLRVPR